MSKTIVVTAHGKVEDKSLTLPVNVLTCSKMGEYHCGSLLQFQEVSMFSEPSFLYKYVMDHGSNYTNRGTLYEKGTTIPNILLQPLKTDDSVKMFSWQKPYVVAHLTKLCRYELADNPKYKDKITPFTINKITLSDIETCATQDKNFSLLTNTKIINEYANSYKYQDNVNISNHVCSITVNKDETVVFIDYEQAPQFATDPSWGINDFFTDLTTFAKAESMPLLGTDGSLDIELAVLKACLSD